MDQKKAQTVPELAQILEDNDFELLRDIFNTIREPLVVLDKNLRVILVNNSFYIYFQVTPEETIGKLIYDLGNRQWDIPQLRTLLEAIVPFNTSFEHYLVQHDFEKIGNRILLLNA